MKRGKELIIEFQEQGLTSAKHCGMNVYWVQEIVSSLGWL